MKKAFATIVIFNVVFMAIAQNNDVYKVIYSDKEYIAFEKNSAFICLKKFAGSKNWIDYKEKVSIYDNDDYEFSKLIKIENGVLTFCDGDYGQVKNIIIFDLNSKKYITRDEYFGITDEFKSQNILLKEIKDIASINDKKLIDKKTVELATQEVKNSSGNLMLQYYQLFQFDTKSKKINSMGKIIGKAIP